jgi:hypothetical protein
MPIIYNIEPAKVDLFAVQGDIIDMEFYINADSLSSAMWKFFVNVNNAPSDGIPFYMYSLRMQVKRKDGLLLKDWLSGVSPADIVVDLIFGGYAHLTDSLGFLEPGIFDYDLKCDNGSGEFTIMKGTWIVEKQITP